MKAVFTFAILVTILSAIATPVHAAEISPTPGTYSYGSTSELSPYEDVIPVDAPTDTLAPTGINTSLLYLLAFFLISLSSFGLYKTTKSKN